MGRIMRGVEKFVYSSAKCGRNGWANGSEIIAMAILGNLFERVIARLSNCKSNSVCVCIGSSGECALVKVKIKRYLRDQ